jgi:hypothetical protein
MMTDLSAYENRYMSQSAGPTVLNPQLYMLLQSMCAGGVIVANQGERFVASWSTDPTTHRAQSHICSSGEYYRVNCPFCRDTRHRLWINHQFGMNDPSGRPLYYLAVCYNDNCLADFYNRQKLSRDLFGFRNANERRPCFLLPPPTFDTGFSTGPAPLPGQLIPMSQLARSVPDHHAVTYLCGKRRYTAHMMDYYDLSYCASPSPAYRMAHDRIIFPITMNGVLKGWQARYIGTADWKKIPKYWGLPGMKKGHFLYNFDHAKDKNFVVVVEGPTDAHVVGDHAVSLLGKSMSHTQLELILQTWPGKPVLLILDPEAEQESRGMLSLMQQYGAIVLQIQLPPGYDCGDYDRTTLWNIIHNQSRQAGIILPM